VFAVAGMSTDHQTVPWWTAAVGVLAVLATGLPVLRWVRPAVDALLFSHPEDAREIVAQLGRRVQAPVSEQDVAAEIAERIRARLRLPYAEIVPAGAALPDGPVRVPLAFSGEPVGTLLVTPRARDRDLSGQDLDLLHELAAQIGIALHAVRVSAELRASRAAVVTAREEERRRIRRDLHDGLGPTLASLRLHLAALEQLVPDRPEEALELVARLRHEVRDTSAQIRGLVYDLRPPLLDEFGLLDALRSKAASVAGVELDLPETLPELPAAIEVALYRIGSEALSNVDRHAAARHVRLALEVMPAEVRLRVADDGRGLPDPLVPGVGLAGMRERAEELRGTLTVAAGDPGTSVTVVLPRG
jgi:two-component system NarL family sensor kinase